MARTMALVISDASLAVAAVVGLVLTAGVILRDTRHRVGLVRTLARSGQLMITKEISR